MEIQPQSVNLQIVVELMAFVESHNNDAGISFHATELIALVCQTLVVETSLTEKHEKVYKLVVRKSAFDLFFLFFSGSMSWPEYNDDGSSVITSILGLPGLFVRSEVIYYPPNPANGIAGVKNCVLTLIFDEKEG